MTDASQTNWPYAGARILAPDELVAWRQAAAAAGEPVAMVAGGYDILQPGNLAAIRAACRIAPRVLVLVEPDDVAVDRHNRGWAWNDLDVRAELVAGVRGVSAVTSCPLPEAEICLVALRPYTFVHCPAQGEGGVLCRVACRLAAGTVDVPALAGCFTREISDSVRRNTTPIRLPPGSCPPAAAREVLDRLLAERARRGALVTVNGCFDILHIGHVRMLAEARAKGGQLVVLINDDASVRAYKGPTRPVFPVEFRLHALQSLAGVDLAWPFSGDNPLALLDVIRPEIHVKGGTYEEARVRQERELAARWGGRLDFVPLVEGHATTHLIGKMRGGLPR